MAGSSISGGGFTKPKGIGSSSTPIGGGGFVQPKPISNNFGSGLSNTGLNSNFGKPSSNSFGSSVPQTTNIQVNNFGNNMKPSSSGSGLLGKASAGLGAGLLGGAIGKGFKKNKYGVNQYAGYSKPKKSFGSYLFGGKKKSYGYKAPGYGTNWGTNFNNGMGQYKKEKKGFSKKALGLGIGAGFLGGAAVGVAGTMATYSVYHKYQEFKRMMYMNQMGGMGGMGMGNPGMGMGMGNPGMGMGMGNPGMGMGMGTGLGVGMMGGGWDDDYYKNYYLTNTCIGGCPINSHCEWGLCECNAGTTRR